MYEVKNNSEIAVILAKAITAEIIRESEYCEDVVRMVVNHYDLENRGLGTMISEIYSTIKQIAGE